MDCAQVCRSKTLLLAKECVELLLGTLLCLQGLGSSVEIPMAQARLGNYRFPGEYGCLKIARGDFIKLVLPSAAQETGQ